jgi:hypothetical protein
MRNFAPMAGRDAVKMPRLSRCRRPGEQSRAEPNGRA